MAGDVALANYPRTRHLAGSERNLKLRAPVRLTVVVWFQPKQRCPSPGVPRCRSRLCARLTRQGATGPNLFGEGEENVGWRARELLRRASANQGAVNVRM